MAIVRAGLQNNIPEIISRIERVKWAVQSEYSSLFKGVLEQTRTELTQTTPKRSGRMATGWKVRTLGGQPKGRVAMAGWVYNYWAEKGKGRYQSQVFAGRRRDVDSGKLLRKGSKRKIDGALILRILEFGSRPHTIEAKHQTKAGRPGMLAFVPSEGGETVFVRKVEHPGTSPVGMIRQARMHLRDRMRKVNLQVARVPQRVMRGEV